MVKCPFCQYDNEEGALFCEQCKSDLGGVEPVAVAHPVEAQVAEVAQAVPIMEGAEDIPVAAVFTESEQVIEAAPVDLGLAVHEPPPVAAPIEGEMFAGLAMEEAPPVAEAPFEAPPFEAPPFEAAPAAPAA